MAQKLTFDKLLEDSIVKRMESLVKWNNVIIEPRTTIEQKEPKVRTFKRGT